MTYEIRTKDRAKIAGGFPNLQDALRWAQLNDSAYWITRTYTRAIAVRDGDGVNGAFIAPNEWPEEGDW